MPRDQRERTDRMQELFGFINQSRISNNNRKRLNELLAHNDAEVQKIAQLVIRVAHIAEGKRRRWRRVKQADYPLYLQCVEIGLIPFSFPDQLADWPDDIDDVDPSPQTPHGE